MRICENCYRRHWRAKLNKNGTQVKHNNGNKVFVCVRCGNVQEEDDLPVIPIPQRIQANILYIDTENSTSIYENYGASPGMEVSLRDYAPSCFYVPTHLIPRTVLAGMERLIREENERAEKLTEQFTLFGEDK